MAYRLDMTDAAPGPPAVGTILWAQAAGYPFWPAQVVSADAVADYCAFLKLPPKKGAEFTVRIPQSRFVLFVTRRCALCMPRAAYT